MRAVAIVFLFAVAGRQRDNALPNLSHQDAPDSASRDDVDLAGADLAGADLSTRNDFDLAPGWSACPASAIFCEDFERGDLSRWDGARRSGGTIAVDGVAPHRGRFALHVTTSGRDFAYVARRLDASGALYARFYVYPVSVGDDELSLAALSQAGFGPSVRTSGPRIGQSEFPGGTWAFGDLASVATIASESGVAVGKWTCVELRADDPSPVWVDGKPAFPSPPGIRPPLGSELDVGVVQSFLSSSAEYFLDDVVAAAAPIGCN